MKGLRASGEPKKEAAAKELQLYEEGFAQAADETHRFYALTSLVESAADTGQVGRAEETARELLDLAPSFPKDWNYGNALFHANYALAKVALSKDDFSQAAQLLVKASETPGSPQLDSFGPKMELATTMLKLGERLAVAEYLKNCSKFWKNDMGRCQEWLKRIENGETIEFDKTDIFKKFGKAK